MRFNIKIFSLFLLCFLSSYSGKGCDCREITDYYDFVKNSKNLFVGAVESYELKKGTTTLVFQVSDKLNMNLPSRVKVSMTSSFLQCHAGFTVGETYLLEIKKQGNSYAVGYCNFIEDSKSKTFSEDTAMIHLLQKKSGYIDNSYFKGGVINGKREGKWVLFYNNDKSKIEEEGNFNNDKKEGLWKSQGSEALYEKGKHIVTTYTIQEENQRLKIEVFNTITKVFYENGSIFKIITSHTYKVFYPNGILKELASIDRNGLICGTWTKYNANGLLTESIKTNDKQIELLEVCYYCYSGE